MFIGLDLILDEFTLMLLWFGMGFYCFYLIWHWFPWFGFGSNWFGADLHDLALNLIDSALISMILLWFWMTWHASPWFWFDLECLALISIDFELSSYRFSAIMVMSFVDCYHKKSIHFLQTSPVSIKSPPTSTTHPQHDESFPEYSKNQSNNCGIIWYRFSLMLDGYGTDFMDVA